jgi:aryl-alcohol dehydrogenase-like predicted oxidoreductase
MKVSEVGFGAWAIGGKSYGAVNREESLRALAKAEELGCNFVDTAEGYGDSESVLGEFLRGRRERWLVATKYSGQEDGIFATIERQLARLKIDTIDFYQLHWAPKDNERQLYDDLHRLKQSGKVRFIGVSLHNVEDIDYVLNHTEMDGLQIPFNLLEPNPYLARIEKIREMGIGIVIRSCLKSGFLTGKFTQNATFADPNDKRHKSSREDIINTVESVEKFRFLEKAAGSMLVVAARYPLSFPETSTVILGTKTASQAEANFGQVPGGVLSDHSMDQIRSVQNAMNRRSYRLGRRLRGALGKYRRKFF